MQTLHISRQELHTRGGVLDRMLDSLFDTAILVDTDCRILYISASSFPDPSQRAAVVGQHISVLDQLSPFEEVLRTGQPRPDLFLELHGRPCISSLFPVLDGERVIGVVGTITVRNLGRLKKVLSQLSDQAAGFRGLYQDLARVDSGYRLEDFVGESPRVADLLDKARKAAHSGESVLILGETGTGKEIIASGIHAERHGGRPLPYVTINCTAIPEQLLESELFGHEKGAFTGATEARMGKFQLAGDGDILLDEIGDMDLQMQSKLLRVLESREFERVGCREIITLRAGIIASTNQNLLAMSERRAFRADPTTACPPSNSTCRPCGPGRRTFPCSSTASAPKRAGGSASPPRPWSTFSGTPGRVTSASSRIWWAAGWCSTTGCRSPDGTWWTS